MFSLILWSLAFGTTVALSSLSGPTNSPTASKKRVHIVTGASGYVGRAIVHHICENASISLIQSEVHHCQDVLCLVRPNRVATEQAYWNILLQDIASPVSVRVLPYDMLDGGASLKDALASVVVEQDHAETCVYHVASVFGPTEDHQQTALDNVKGTEDLVRTLVDSGMTCRLIMTSSMAAVRGSGQRPRNGKYYTEQDWNTISLLGANWGASYQWSKAESERKAWEICQHHNIPMVALCPSFVFGPPRDSINSNSYSITLVGQWARGESQVQSRLFVDVRDVAAAHVAAAIELEAAGQRYIVSLETRAPSQDIATWLREVCQTTGLSDPEKVHFDGEFDGGAIPIGSKEVDAIDRLRRELRVTLRPIKDTIRDMAGNLLKETAQNDC